MSISVRRPYRNVSAIWSGFATTPRKAVPCLFLVESFPEGEPLLEWCEHYQLEGIVSKKLSSRYASGTCRDWQKNKCNGWREANQFRHKLQKLCQRISKPCRR